jgi:hypothetical protein
MKKIPNPPDFINKKDHYRIFGKRRGGSFPISSVRTACEKSESQGGCRDIVFHGKIFKRIVVLPINKPLLIKGESAG